MTIANVPNDVLNIMFSYLDGTEATQNRGVCKKWSQLLAKHPLVAQKFDEIFFNRLVSARIDAINSGKKVRDFEIKTLCEYEVHVLFDPEKNEEILHYFKNGEKNCCETLQGMGTLSGRQFTTRTVSWSSKQVRIITGISLPRLEWTDTKTQEKISHIACGGRFEDMVFLPIDKTNCFYGDDSSINIIDFKRNRTFCEIETTNAVHSLFLDKHQCILDVEMKNTKTIKRVCFIPEELIAFKNVVKLFKEYASEANQEFNKILPEITSKTVLDSLKEPNLSNYRRWTSLAEYVISESTLES